jgi:hypothetical protein
MEEFLLDMMGSAAVASAVIAGIMATRMSREMARAGNSRLEQPRPNRDATD